MKPTPPLLLLFTLLMGGPPIGWNAVLADELPQNPNAIERLTAGKARSPVEVVVPSTIELDVKGFGEVALGLPSAARRGIPRRFSGRGRAGPAGACRSRTSRSGCSIRRNDS